MQSGYSAIDHKSVDVPSGTGISNTVGCNFTCIRNSISSNTRVDYLNGVFTFSAETLKNSGVYTFFHATRIA